MVTKPRPAHMSFEMPRLVYEPFDTRKSSTWRARHSVAERLLPDNQIGKLRVRRYTDTDTQQELGELQDTKASVQSEKAYGDMFGADMRGRSTRKSLIRDKRKSLADR
ncbi:hypothetical protein KR032_005522 [Drosophila birchii]|nr:hypothetical protein KR032_005522 [Drosophila birchii]